MNKLHSVKPVLEERSSTSVWALSVYSDSSPHFGAIILLEKGKIYLVEEMWWNHLDCVVFKTNSILL